LKGISIKKFIPGIAWFFVLMVLICLPGSDIPTVDTWLNTIYFDKWVHTGLFGMLGFLFMLPVFSKKLSIPYDEQLRCCIRVTMAVIVWGITTEFIQLYFISGRNFDLLDWAADSFGALLAFAFVKWRFLKRK
jgi:VanZ family protein